MSVSPTVATLSCERDFADSAEHTNIQTPVKILATTCPLQDLSPEPLFGLLTHTRVQTYTLKSIAAFAIVAGKLYHRLLRQSWQHYKHINTHRRKRA